MISACVRSPASGLSPRVRGNQLTERLNRDRFGSIPARAGEPFAVGKRACGFRVYPRACGGCCVIASKNDIYNREDLPHNLQRYVPT